MKMESECDQSLGEVFCDVIEALAFMFGEETSKQDLPQQMDTCVEARMSFTGPLRGELAIAVPAQTCAEIAANVLGVDEDDGLSNEEAIDALNITCGHELTTLAGEEPVFDLSVPVVTQLGADGWAKFMRSVATSGFLVDEGPMLLQLVMTDRED